MCSLDGMIRKVDPLLSSHLGLGFRGLGFRGLGFRGLCFRGLSFRGSVRGDLEFRGLRLIGCVEQLHSCHLGVAVFVLDVKGSCLLV